MSIVASFLIETHSSLIRLPLPSLGRQPSEISVELHAGMLYSSQGTLPPILRAAFGSFHLQRLMTF